MKFQNLNYAKIVLVYSTWTQRLLDVHKPSNVFILKYTNNLSDSEGFESGLDPKMTRLS